MTGYDDKNMRRVLYAAAKKIDLAKFIEQVSGMAMEPKGPDRYMGLCPIHGDNDPSFSVTMEDDGVFLFHCFGCGLGGTIVDFCMAFFHLEHPSEALETVISQSGLECDHELVSKVLKEERVGFDTKKNLETHHFSAARNCLLLLKTRSSKETMDWVRDAYWNMNKMLIAEDVIGIRNISNEAIARMRI